MKLIYKKTFSVFQIILRWIVRFILGIICFLCLTHFNENYGVLILSGLCLFWIALMNEDEILVYEDSFVFRKKYFLNLLKYNYKFNFSEIIDTDLTGHHEFIDYRNFLPSYIEGGDDHVNKLFVRLNDNTIKTIKTFIYKSDLEETCSQINKLVLLTKEKF